MFKNHHLNRNKNQFLNTSQTRKTKLRRVAYQLRMVQRTNTLILSPLLYQSSRVHKSNSSLRLRTTKDLRFRLLKMRIEFIKRITVSLMCRLLVASDRVHATLSSRSLLNQKRLPQKRRKNLSLKEYLRHSPEKKKLILDKLFHHLVWQAPSKRRILSHQSSQAQLEELKGRLRLIRVQRNFTKSRESSLLPLKRVLKFTNMKSRVQSRPIIYRIDRENMFL